MTASQFEKDFEDQAFIEELNSLLSICTDYAVLPHIQSAAHRYLVHEAEAFAICDCTISIYYDKVSKKSPTLLSPDQLAYLLLINPNTVTYWNCRRRIIQSCFLAPEVDLFFTRLILNTHPRSNETLFHRQWILLQYYSTDAFLLESELEFCDHIADKYWMHYALWDYRRSLISLLGPQVYIKELTRVGQWLLRHPTDTSGWTYLAHTISLVYHQAVIPVSEIYSLLITKWNEIIDILRLYPERECVWIFRRYLFLVFASLALDRHPSINCDLKAFEPLYSDAVELRSRLYANHALVRSIADLVAQCSPLYSFEGSWPRLLLCRYLLWLGRHVVRY